MFFNSSSLNPVLWRICIRTETYPKPQVIIVGAGKGVRLKDSLQAVVGTLGVGRRYAATPSGLTTCHDTFTYAT